MSQLLSPQYTEARPPVKQVSQSLIVKLPVSVSIEKTSFDGKHFFNISVENTLEDDSLSLEIQDLKCFTKFGDVLLTSTEPTSPPSLLSSASTSTTSLSQTPYTDSSVPLSGSSSSGLSSSDGGGSSTVPSLTASTDLGPTPSQTPTSPIQSKLSAKIALALGSSSASSSESSSGTFTSFLSAFPARTPSASGFSQSSATPQSQTQVSPVSIVSAPALATTLPTSSSDGHLRAESVAPSSEFSFFSSSTCPFSLLIRCCFLFSDSFSMSIARQASGAKLILPTLTAPLFHLSPLAFPLANPSTSLKPNPTNDFVIRFDRVSPLITSSSFLCLSFLLLPHSLLTSFLFYSFRTAFLPAFFQGNNNPSYSQLH
jgi:hypothetical protein